MSSSVGRRPRAPGQPRRRRGIPVSLETLAESPPRWRRTWRHTAPGEVGEYLRRVAFAPELPETGIRMDRREFLRPGRSAGRCRCREVVHEARCVVEVVSEAMQGTLTHKKWNTRPDCLPAPLDQRRGSSNATSSSPAVCRNHPHPAELAAFPTKTPLIGTRRELSHRGRAITGVGP
jgi:hypothetical protein